MATLGELAQGASCYRCLEDQQAAMLWQLDQIRILAGGSIMNLEQIAQGASCYTCLPDKLAAVVFLFNELGESATGGGVSGVCNCPEVYVTDPNTEGVKPDNVNLTAMAYSADGSGAIFGWSVLLQLWV